MKTLGVLLLVAFGLVGLGVIGVQGWQRWAASRVDVPAAVRQLLDDQARAWNENDLEGFMQGYWKSEELTFFSGGTVKLGWQATIDRYRQRYQKEGKEMGRLAFEDLVIEPTGADGAFVRGRFVLDRDKEQLTGLFTLIVKRRPEGWRIVHDHTSGDPPPAKPAAP